MIVKKEDDLLTLPEIKCFRMQEVYKTIKGLYRLMIRYQDINLNVILPSITSDYKIRYGCFLPDFKNSKTENYVIKKLMLEAREEEDRQKFLTHFTIALKKLSNNELIVFKLAFYERCNDLKIAEKTYRNEKTIRRIRKSAYIRLLIALGMEDKCLY